MLQKVNVGGEDVGNSFGRSCYFILQLPIGIGLSEGEVTSEFRVKLVVRLVPFVCLE